MSAHLSAVSRLAAAALVPFVACEQPAADTAAPASSAAPAVSAAAPAPSASSAPAPASARAAVPSPAKAAPVVWAGTYTSSPGSLYVCDGGEWKGVHFRGDDASAGIGDGSLALTIDPTTNTLRGTGDGPLGEVVLSGAVTGPEVTFTVFRKTPADRGLTGTGSGTLSGDILAGTMHLSQGDAHVIREAKFRLAKAAP